MNFPVLLEVVIGMITVWLFLAIIGSGVAEVWSTKRRLRAKFLRRGLVNLVPDQWAYLRLLFHPTLRGAFGDEPGKREYPSYLTPRDVARALVDVVLDKAAVARGDDPNTRTAVTTAQQVADAFAVLKTRGDPLVPMLLPLLQRTDNTPAALGGTSALDDLYARVEAWYASSMDRVSGWYKRQTHWNLFVIGTLIAVVANVDSIALFNHFATHPQAREVVVQAAQRYIDANKEAATAAKTGTAPPAVADTKATDAKPADAKDPAATSAETDAAKAAADARFRQAVTDLASLQDAGLPIGFKCLADPLLAKDGGYEKTLQACGKQVVDAVKAPGLLLRVIGWLITGIMVSFGAPFWFDLLKKLMQVRGAGPKPAATGG